MTHETLARVLATQSIDIAKYVDRIQRIVEANRNILPAATYDDLYQQSSNLSDGVDDLLDMVLTHGQTTVSDELTPDEPINNEPITHVKRTADKGAEPQEQPKPIKKPMEVPQPVTPPTDVMPADKTTSSHNPATEDIVADDDVDQAAQLAASDAANDTPQSNAERMANDDSLVDSAVTIQSIEDGSYAKKLRDEAARDKEAAAKQQKLIEEGRRKVAQYQAQQEAAQSQQALDTMNQNISAKISQQLDEPKDSAAESAKSAAKDEPKSSEPSAEPKSADKSATEKAAKPAAKSSADDAGKDAGLFAGLDSDDDDDKDGGLFD